jgi:hypothetical protein
MSPGSGRITCQDQDTLAAAPQYEVKDNQSDKDNDEQPTPPLHNRSPSAVPLLKYREHYKPSGQKGKSGTIGRRTANQYFQPNITSNT